METPEKIKRGMKYLSIKDITQKMDMWKEGIAYDYAEDAAADALAYIQQLEQDNTQKDERIRQLEREREAMLRQLSMHCEACKYWESPMSCKECSTCTNPWKVNPKENWEWRGVEEDANES